MPSVYGPVLLLSIGNDPENNIWFIDAALTNPLDEEAKDIRLIFTDLPADDEDPELFWAMKSRWSILNLTRLKWYRRPTY